jgi:hypothetical protein
MEGSGGSGAVRQLVNGGKQAAGNAAAGEDVAEVNGRDFELPSGSSLGPALAAEGVSGGLNIRAAFCDCRCSHSRVKVPVALMTKW